MPRRKTPIITSNDVPAAPEVTEGGVAASDIQVVQERDMNYKAREAKFMNEPVTIQIEPGTKDNDPMFVPLGHNGTCQYVLRGEPQVVKRKFLYSGLMAKVVRMNCDFRRGPGDTEINKLTPSTKLGYSMQLIRDDNPQGGMRWFQRVMAEATGIRV
jgi:hypothetical protein